MNGKKRLCLHICLIGLGGALYTLIELLWRRRTHWSMFFVGGVCFDIIGGIHRRCHRLSAAARCTLCAVAVTAVEFVSGCVLNGLLKLGVWDYSGMRFHLKGQVCLLYSLFWVVLSGLCRPVYERCRCPLERRLCRKGTPSAGDTARI